MCVHSDVLITLRSAMANMQITTMAHRGIWFNNHDSPGDGHYSHWTEITGVSVMLQLSSCCAVQQLSKPLSQVSLVALLDVPRCPQWIQTICLSFHFGEAQSPRCQLW